MNYNISTTNEHLWRELISSKLANIHFFQKKALLQRMGKESHLYLAVMDSSFPKCYSNIFNTLSADVHEMAMERVKERCKKYEIEADWKNYFDLSGFNFNSENTKLRFCCYFYNALFEDVNKPIEWKKFWWDDKKKIVAIDNRLDDDERIDIQTNNFEYLQLLELEISIRQEYIDNIKTKVKNYKGFIYRGDLNLMVKNGVLKKCRKDKDFSKAKDIDPENWQFSHFAEKVDKLFNDN